LRRQRLLDFATGLLARLLVPLVGDGEPHRAVAGLDPTTAAPLAPDLHGQPGQHRPAPRSIDLILCWRRRRRLWLAAPALGLRRRGLGLSPAGRLRLRLLLGPCSLGP